MAAYYPPVGFYFRLEVLELDQAKADDVRFSEVGGLSLELATEEVAEGGENRFLQKYPARSKYPELVLKRGLLMKSALFDWVMAALQDFSFSPKQANLQLLNEQGEPLMSWHFTGVYPTRWSVSDFNAQSNTVVVESLQLYYQSYTVTKA